jgi:hypothetical protein
MTEHDYEFRVKIGRDTVSGTYDAPKVNRGDLGTADIHRDEHLETIELLEAWLKRWEWIARRPEDERLLVPDTFRVLGNHLWNMALREVPGPRLIDAIEAVKRSQIRPRPTVSVRMSFAGDAGDLAALPWEFVHLPGDAEFFLAAETSLTLGRYLDGRGFHDADFLSADNKLRVLIVVSLPERAEFDDERAAMHTLASDLDHLGDSGTGSRIQLKLYEGWNHEQVANELAEFHDDPDGGRVDVVHLTALFRRGDEHQIYLPNVEHRWRWTNALPVVRALTADPDNRPKLVILHLCDWHDSDSANAPEHFEQLAPEFIRNEIPAVLAMQYPMRPVHGCDFVTRLYRRLADGMNIGAAVQATRNDFVYRHDRYFGTPVLYMQSRVDGGLVTRVAGGDDADAPVHRERRPLVEKPPAESAASSDLVFELAQIVDDMQGTRTTADLAEWINAQAWPVSVTDPADRKQAEKIIRLHRRQHNDNPEADEILQQLLRRVVELARQAG